MSINRRDFFIKTAKGIALISIPSVLPAILESCKDNPGSPSNIPSNMPTVSGTLANNTVTVNIDSGSVLYKTGQAAIVDYVSGSVMVDHPAEGVFNAYSRICTHQGCTIYDFETSSQQFVCNCHGSRFTSSGKVAQGPANQPLTSYPTQFANNVLKITIQ